MIIHIVAEAANITALNAAAIKAAIEGESLVVKVLEINNSGNLVLKVV